MMVLFCYGWVFVFISLKSVSYESRRAHETRRACVGNTVWDAVSYRCTAEALLSPCCLLLLGSDQQSPTTTALERGSRGSVGFRRLRLLESYFLIWDWSRGDSRAHTGVYFFFVVGCGLVSVAGSGLVCWTMMVVSGGLRAAWTWRRDETWRYFVDVVVVVDG